MGDDGVNSGCLKQCASDAKEFFYPTIAGEAHRKPGWRFRFVFVLPGRCHVFFEEIPMASMLGPQISVQALWRTSVSTSFLPVVRAERYACAH